jgi:hypothetical protein
MKRLTQLYKTILTTISVLLAVYPAQLPAQTIRSETFPRNQQPAAGPSAPKGQQESTLVFNKVPSGKIYVVYDANRKKVAEFKSGQKTNMTSDCLPFPCPFPFHPRYICWICPEFTAQPPSQPTGQSPGPILSGYAAQPGITYARVPSGKTYVVYNANRRNVAQFRSGQKTNMGTDCVITKCPPTFGKDVVCWKCVGFTAR